MEAKIGGPNHVLFKRITFAYVARARARQDMDARGQGENSRLAASCKCRRDGNLFSFIVRENSSFGSCQICWARLGSSSSRDARRVHYAIPSKFAGRLPPLRHFHLSRRRRRRQRLVFGDNFLRANLGQGSPRAARWRQQNGGSRMVIVMMPSIDNNELPAPGPSARLTGTSGRASERVDQHFPLARRRSGEAKFRAELNLDARADRRTERDGRSIHGLHHRPARRPAWLARRLAGSRPPFESAHSSSVLWRRSLSGLIMVAAATRKSEPNDDDADAEDAKTPGAPRDLCSLDSAMATVQGFGRLSDDAAPADWPLLGMRALRIGDSDLCAQLDAKWAQRKQLQAALGTAQKRQTVRRFVLLCAAHSFGPD